MNNHINKIKQWDAISHPRPNLTGGLIKPLLELGPGQVIIFRITPLVVIIAGIVCSLLSDKCVSSQDRGPFS